MSSATATIRELRIDFRSVKRKIEHHGSVVITDNGVPSYEIKALPHESPRGSAMPDYMRRLKRRQPKPISAEKFRALWDYERGDR